MTHRLESKRLTTDIIKMIDGALGRPEEDGDFAHFSPSTPIWEGEGATIVTLFKRKASEVYIYSVGVRSESPSRDRIGLHAATLHIPLMSDSVVKKKLNMAYFSPGIKDGKKDFNFMDKSSLEDLKWFRQIIEDSVIYGKRLPQE
jgi:hypothetical protein